MEKSYAQHYALLEAEHWWFRARRMILRNLLCQLVWPPQIVYRKLRPGGRIVVSAPAYMWLWGQQDVVNQHYRRYTSLELRRKLQASDFVIERVTYFNTILFAPIAAVRLLARCSGKPH